MKNLLTSATRMAKNVKRGYDHFGRRSYVTVLTGLGALTGLIPGLLHATPTVGDLGTNTGDNSTGVTDGTLRIAGAIGVVFLVVALVKLKDARKQGESIGTYIGMALFGALLFAIPTLISILNVSVIGTDASQTIQGQIIQ